MRRLIAGFAATLVLTGTLQVLPVYAAPVPEAEPVPASIDQVDLGSVEAPAAEAVVATDGELVAAGADAVVVAEEPTGGQPGAAEPVEPSGPAEATEVPIGTPVDVPSSGSDEAGVPVLTLAQPETDQFSAVGVTWRHDDSITDVTVQVRVQRDGSWGGWTALEQDEVEQAPQAGRTDVRDGTAPYFTGPATGIEVTVQAADGQVPTDVQTQLIDPGTSEADATLGAPAVVSQAHAAVSMPPIHSRAQWGADESIRTWDPSYSPTVKAATLHHTADSNGYSQADVPRILRSIYAYHTISRAWGDIGYNVVVDKFGRAWEGRYSGSRGIASPIIGAHSGGFNSGTFGVSMLGNYAEAQTTQPMIDMVSAVIGWKLSLYGVDPQGWTNLTSGGGGTSKYPAGASVSVPTVFGHRDVGNTTCPGQYGYAKLTEIRAKAATVYAQRSVAQGSLDEVSTGFQKVTVRGWALDLDTPVDPVQVHVYVDGRSRVATTASGARPDIAAAYPTANAAHGYQVSLEVSAGNHQVCTYAINTGAGNSNPQLGCKDVTVQGYQAEPIGSLDTVRALGDRIGVGGWALDGSAPGSPVSAHVYVDGRYATAVTADRSRPDIDAAFPGAGAAHGLAAAVTATVGTHSVCVYLLNIGTGSTNPLLGCRDVVVPATVDAPVGGYDGVAVRGREATVSGWTVDPNAASSAGSVHVYVDGRFARAVTADLARPDVVAAFGGIPMSASRGYATTLELHSGQHQVCVFALNQGAGSDNPLQGCSTVDVAAAAWDPQGTLDSASVVGITATLRGWAADYDIADSPTTVHLYVDGTFRKAVLADSSRPDVGAALGVGSRHGLETRLSLPAGTHTICAYALNVGDGTTNRFIGCKTASVAASAWSAYGSLDTASVTGGQVLVRGWAVDSDAVTRTLQVHVYVNASGTALTADVSRPDVATARPGAGPLHGYEARVALPAGGGPYTVCAYAIGVGDGETNVPLGCRAAS